ncbi:MAG: hypothetical protein GX197_02115 [Firmicutes bacterium]|nr:hypothetical protein [Bacillota bacterium]
MYKPLFEISKHMDLVSLTAEILKNDGKGDVYRLLVQTDQVTGKTGLELLAEGTKDADLPFSGGYILHFMHFHHPWSHRGYLSKSSSADETVKIYHLAKNKWQNGYRHEALYQLGRALHLVQDINIPHHAGITALKKHGKFEKWLTVHGRKYLVKSGGFYQWEKVFVHPNGQKHYVTANNIYDWIDYGSHLSFPLFANYFAQGKNDEKTFQKIAAIVMPNVLRLSAGFLGKFFCEVNI